MKLESLRKLKQLLFNDFDLLQEGEEKHRLDSEFRKLQKENKRLQEDLRTASHQLRKFTEWFFSTMEQNKTC